MSMQTTLRAFLVLSLVHGLTACTSPSSVDCAKVTVPKYTEMTAWARCVTCHSSSLSGASRAGAPPGVDFDNYDAALADADEALSEVEDGEMPPSGSPQLSAAEKDQILHWASCDTPQ
jgi:uncharacterized membrane protein